MQRVATHGTHLTIVFRGDQQQPTISGLSYSAEILDDIGTDTDAAKYLCEMAFEAAQCEDIEVIVCSWNQEVRKTLDLLIQERRITNVKFQPMASVLPPREPQPSPTIPAWDESFDSKDGAAAVLVRALSGAGNEGIGMNRVRVLVQEVDARYRKVEGTFSNHPKFVRALLNVGQDKGYIEQVAGSHATNPIFRLSPAGRQFFNTLPQTTEQPQGAPAAGQRADNSTSDIFISALRNAKFGPFQEVRLAVYDQIEALSAANLPVSELINRAVAAVQQSATLSPDKTKQFPWPRVNSFILKLFKARPVLIAGSEVFTPNLMSLDKVVTGLVDDWQMELDGELVVFLLSAQCKITLDDVPDLSGALYNSRRDEFIGRVYKLLSRLALKSRIRESDAGEFLLVA